MRRTLCLGAAVTIVLGTLCTMKLGAHEDDPKLLDRQPPTVAPAFRSSGPNPSPLSVGFPSNGVQLLSWLPLAEFGSPSSGNDCWGYVSGSGREYAIFGHSSGTAFVEITDPGNPDIIANLSGPGSLWRDIKVYDDYAYAVSEGGSGIQVFDMSNIDSGTVSFVRNIGSDSTHNVGIDTTSGYLYRTGGGSNGLRIYDLNSNPSNPPFVAQWQDRYVHDAHPFTYTSGPLTGTQLVFCFGGLNGGFDDTNLTVVDVTNKSNITVRGSVSYPNRRYSHQGWFDGSRYLYLGDEIDEGSTVSTTTTYIFDIQNPDNPQYVTSFTNGNAAVDHNMYILDDLLYQANYRSGLRVWDISNRTNPVEVAWFDTYPSNDSPSYNGLWSCYPYFPSGSVIGSDLESGLFVWRVGEPAIALSLPSGTPDTVDPSGDSVTVQIEEIDGTLTPGTAKLHYDDGSGLVTVDLMSAGGDLWNAIFGTTNCTSTVSWYVSAEGSDGITRYLPANAPGTTYSATSAAGANLIAEETMESNPGWTVGAAGDDASTGIWTRTNPIGTDAQPEDDHTPAGTQCWFTGQGSSGGSVGENDVDDGKTTLLTDAFDLSSDPNATISYWRWFSNNQGASPNSDVFTVDISNNNGASWFNVEVVGPTGSESGGGWFFHQFTVNEIVTPTSSMRMRFVAADEGDGSIVEAAIDDFQISTLICEDCNDNGVEDSEDISGGFSDDCNSNGTPDECDIANGTSADLDMNGIPDECESFITDCGAGQINTGCGASSNVLFLNGSAGGSERTHVVSSSTPLTFSIKEAPSKENDAAQSKAIVYMWFAIPGASDVVQLPKQLGPMCFGPKLVETRPADFIWNSIGIANKAGSHNAPTPPPFIPDNATLDFYDLPAGWGQTLDITVQGFLPDDCSQGTKPFSVTNGFVVRVQ